MVGKNGTQVAMGGIEAEGIEKGQPAKAKEAA